MKLSIAFVEENTTKMSFPRGIWGTKEGKSFSSVNYAGVSRFLSPGGAAAFDAEGLFVFFNCSCLLVLHIFTTTRQAHTRDRGAYNIKKWTLNRQPQITDEADSKFLFIWWYFFVYWVLLF